MWFDRAPKSRPQEQLFTGTPAELKDLQSTQKFDHINGNNLEMFEFILEPLIIFSIGMLLCVIAGTTLRIFLRDNNRLAFDQPLHNAVFNAVNFPVIISLFIYGFLVFDWWQTPVVFVTSTLISSSFIVKPRSETNLIMNYRLMPLLNAMSLIICVLLWGDYFEYWRLKSML